MKPNFLSALRYASFVWLGGVIVSPLLYFILDQLILKPNDPSYNAHLGGVLLLLVAVGGVYSIPCWLALALLTFLVNKMDVEAPYRKVVLFFACSILTYAPFYLFFDLDYSRIVSEDFNQNPIPLVLLSYWIVISAGVFYFDLVRKRKPELQAEGILDHL